MPYEVVKDPVQPHKCDLPATSKADEGARIRCTDCGRLYVCKHHSDESGLFGGEGWDWKRLHLGGRVTAEGMFQFACILFLAAFASVFIVAGVIRLLD